MSDKKSGRFPAIALLLAAALCSCKELKRPPAPAVPPPSPDQKYFTYSTERLLSYAGELARLGPVDRLTECNKVLELYRANQQTGVLLHLFVAQLASDACGDPVRVLALVRTLKPTLQDERLRNFLSFEGLLADRAMQAAAEKERIAKKLRETRWRLRQAQTKEKRAETKGKKIYERMISRDAEAKQLKQKLDALKSIEQDLNEETERHDTHE